MLTPASRARAAVEEPDLDLDDELAELYGIETPSMRLRRQLAEEPPRVTMNPNRVGGSGE